MNILPCTGPRLRTAAYCRVSTATEMQEGSYEQQAAHYASWIARRTDMTLVAVYGDKGKTGRSIHGRPGFQHMMEAAEAGKLDFIVTKSISRFARNMADCLAAVRRLQALQVAVLFEEEGINTLDSRCELLLSIMAGIAAEESNSLAQNVRWAMERSNGRGEPFFRASYGYRKSAGSHCWQVDEAAARRVRCAFALAAQGVGCTEIAMQLTAMEAEEGSTVYWSRKRVRYLLANVSYVGDCLTNKTFTAYTCRRVQMVNHGERDQYYLENHHEPLVSREVFEQVQARLQARRVTCTPEKSIRNAKE